MAKYLDEAGLAQFKAKNDVTYAADLTLSGNATIQLKNNSNSVIASATIATLSSGAANPGLLSTSDYTLLKSISSGAEVNVIEEVQVNGAALTVTSKAVNIDLTSYAKEEDLDKLRAGLSNAVTYKGSVNTWANLPASPTTGDMYNVKTADTTHGLEANGNVIWNGSSWDVSDNTISIDAITSAYIDGLFV